MFSWKSIDQIGKNEALIKISTGKFIDKIDKKLNSLKKFKGIEEPQSQNNDYKNTNSINHEFSSDTTNLILLIFYRIYLNQILFSILNQQV